MYRMGWYIWMDFSCCRVNVYDPCYLFFVCQMATAESLITSSRMATATSTVTAGMGEGKQKSVEPDVEQDSLSGDEKIPITKKKTPKTKHKLPRFARAGALLSSTLYKNITCSENVPQTSMTAPAKF